jgi:hypothetical protein
MRLSRLVMVPVLSISLLGAASSLCSDARPMKNSRADSVRIADLYLASEDYPMGRGCCSWHGGECGCKDGRDVCCDGTFSPSCSCHK